MRLLTRRHLFTTILTLLWLGGLCAGGRALLTYGQEAGAVGMALPAWPATSELGRTPNISTLVILLHPQCPCSRATVSELAELMAHAQGKVTTHVLFAEPAGAPADWTKGGLWGAVSAIPGVHPQRDEGGIEARRFGAETSGQAVLFDAAGRLKFRGGITAARGHAGPNAGSTAITALLQGSAAPVEETRVYGCALF